MNIYCLHLKAFAYKIKSKIQEKQKALQLNYG